MSKLSLIALVSALALAPTLVAADASAVVNGAASTAAGATTNDNSASAGVNTDVSAAASGALDNSSANGSANGSASAGASLNFGDLISGLNANGDDSATITAIGSATSSTTINIVPVSSLKASANADAHALANAEAKATDRLGKLRAAVHANAAIEAALTAKGYNDNQVVAVQADASANIWIYVDDSSK